MPFDGSAIARSHSAEYIAAARLRSRSLSGSATGPIRNADIAAEALQAAEVYDRETPPQLFIVPSPIYAVARRDDEHYRGKSPTSPKRPKRALSGVSRRGTETIPEAAEEAAAREDPPPTQPTRTGSSSDSSRTLGGEAADRDVEAGDIDGEPVVGEPIYRQKEYKDKDKADKDALRAGKEEPKSKEQKRDEKEEDPFLVTLKGREKLNPHTWNQTYRWFLTGLAGLFVLNATFGTSVLSALLLPHWRG